MAGSVAIATAVALVGNSASIDRTLFIEALGEQVASIDDRFAVALRSSRIGSLFLPMPQR